VVSISRIAVVERSIIDLDRVFGAVDVKTGAVLCKYIWRPPCKAFRYRSHPGGWRYIAVTDIHHPANGNVLYVFALRQK
jgi:hypothetical protein